MRRHLHRLRRSGLLRLAATAWLLTALPAFAADGFLLPGPSPRIEASADPAEVVLRFGGPVDGERAEALGRIWPDLVEFVSTGYDQILIRGKRALRARLEPAADGTRLLLEAAPAAAGPSDIGAREALIRRELTLARLDAARGETLAARQRLERLAAEHGDRADILAAMAGLEEQRGNLRPARDMYRRAGQLDGDNEYYSDAARRTGRAAAPFLRVDGDAVNVKNSDRQEIRLLQGQAAVGPRTEAGFSLESRRIEVNTAANLDGSTRSQIDTAKERAEFFASHSFETGGTGRAALYQGPEGAPGGALAYTLRDSRESTSFGITYRRPYWELVSGLLNGGTQDFAELRHERQFGDTWSTTGSLRYSRYGVDDDGDVAKSVGILATLRRALPFDFAETSIGYAFDGEYLHTQDRFAVGNGLFRPLAITTKEIHSLDVTLGREILDGARLDLFTGYAHDRYNDGGPFLGATLAFTGADSFEAGLRASRAKALSRGEQSDVNRVGAYALWRF